jgi:hypothetical protein
MAATLPESKVPLLSVSYNSKIYLANFLAYSTVIIPPYYGLTWLSKSIFNSFYNEWKFYKKNQIF